MCDRLLQIGVNIMMTWGVPRNIRLFFADTW